MAEWWEEEAFTEAGHAAATAERLTHEELTWHKRIAQGMKLRAERFGFWRTRQYAVEWLEVLDSGDDREWLKQRRQEVWDRAVAEGFIEPLLTGNALYGAMNSVFEEDRRR